MKTAALCSRLLARVALAGAASAIFAFSPLVRASVIDLGTAAGYTVLSYNTPIVADSAFQGGGAIGVVNGNWTQSGGQQTGTQQPTTVYLSPGFKNNGPNVLTTVFDGPKMTRAWTDANNASQMPASLTPTDILGAITTNTTINNWSSAPMC